MFGKAIFVAVIGTFSVGSLALPWPFGDHSVIEYCIDRYPLDCHFERVHKEECVKLRHPAEVYWVAGINDCWLYSDEKCSSDGKRSLAVLPFAFDSPFDAKAVYCS